MTTNADGTPNHGNRILIGLGLALLLLTGCLGMPQGVKPVEGVDFQRYLGRWYEIARLDHSFERGLSRVTADYSLRSDGGIRVLNRGYSTRDGVWKEAEGRAAPVGSPGQGHLKVSFFGPFYSSYVIMALDPRGYEYAMVCGYSHSYLWILARSPVIDPAIVENLVRTAGNAGFPVQDLIYVAHDKKP